MENEEKKKINTPQVIAKEFLLAREDINMPVVMDIKTQLIVQITQRITSWVETPQVIIQILKKGIDIQNKRNIVKNTDNSFHRTN